MNKLFLVVLLFAVLQATYCSPAKRNWDNELKEEDSTAAPTEYDRPTETYNPLDKEEKDQMSLEDVQENQWPWENQWPLEEEKEDQMPLEVKEDQWSLKEKEDQMPLKKQTKEEMDNDNLAENVEKELKHDEESSPYDDGNEQDIVEGDIKLTPAQAAIFKESGWDGLVNSEAWGRNHGVWPRIIPYTISGIRTQERQALMKSIAMFHKYTCLRFVRRTTQRDYLNFINGGGCWSYIGRIGGAQRISLGPGCGAAVPVHEILHALGRHHEQSRSDRDTYVFVNFTNIPSRARGNFNKQTTSDNQSMPYDYESLMHYSAYAFAVNRRVPTIQPKCPGVILGQRARMSMLDIMHINIRFCPERVIRLVNGSSRNEGRVEVYWEKEWGTVCTSSFGQSDANVICKYLGYSRGARTVSSRNAGLFGQGSGPIWFSNMRCTGNERSPFHCPQSYPFGRNYYCQHTMDVGVVCINGTTGPTRPSSGPNRPADAVRLVNGTTMSRHAGRVEVFVGGRWGTICDDSFGAQEAKVICRQLGYCNERAFRYYHWARYGQGTVPILLDDLNCTGDESDIRDCPRSGNRQVGSHNCSHREDASVKCM